MRQIEKTYKKGVLRKLLIKFCRLLGYELIDQADMSFVTSLNNRNASKIGKKSITLPLGEIKIKRKIDSLDIILKTCTSVNLVTQNKKRIFDINFSKLSSDEKMDSLSLFKRFSYLLEIFYYNKDLKNKFETLAKKNNLISWINFFNIKKIEINNISDRDNIIKRINQIRKESSDKVLIRLVNKHLSEINEKF